MSLKPIASHFSKVKNLNTKLVLTVLLSALSFNAMADYQVEDSEGVKTLEAQPVRVAALNWDIAEQVIELGVTPVAVPDIAGYSDWVVQPAIPEGVTDIGTRTEPSFLL